MNGWAPDWYSGPPWLTALILASVAGVLAGIALYGVPAFLMERRTRS